MIKIYRGLSIACFFAGGWCLGEALYSVLGLFWEVVLFLGVLVPCLMWNRGERHVRQSK